MVSNWFYQHFITLGLSPTLAEIAASTITISLLLLVLLITTLIIRRLLLRGTTAWMTRNRYSWDDILVKNQLFHKLSWFIPLLATHLAIDALLPPESSIYIFTKRLLLVCFVIVVVFSVNALLASINEIYRQLGKKRADVLNGFTDAGKIVAYLLGLIFIGSILSGVSPWGIISILGGLTAVTMLVFKDTILGFVASVQLTMTDMVRIGDWIEMPAYGADGDVISISIHTIRVQNWDKTISTIPTYALVTNSFKNWRGMTESRGRRIKRALMIDIESIRFCDHTLLERLGSVKLLAPYLVAKEKEIEAANKEAGVAGDDNNLINGRHQTNIGVFRAYVIAYLKNNPIISQEMTFLVRHLQPTEHGLPLEIYVFSRDQRWAQYEAIQADIFDHLFAALPSFELRAFQSPSGYDMRTMAQRMAG
jgi:miniconductance mechanosensitive channel